MTFSPISTIGGSQQRQTSFQYSTSWGINYFQMKLTCREDIPLAIDPELYTDWENFFMIQPYEPPSTPTDPTSPNTNQNNVLLPIILGSVGGFLGLGAIATTIIVVVKRRKKEISPVYLESLMEASAVQTHYCVNCGSKVEMGDKFCTNCGAKRDG